MDFHIFRDLGFPLQVFEFRDFLQLTSIDSEIMILVSRTEIPWKRNFPVFRNIPDLPAFLWILRFAEISWFFEIYRDFHFCRISWFSIFKSLWSRSFESFGIEIWKPVFREPRKKKSIRKCDTCVVSFIWLRSMQLCACAISFTNFRNKWHF